MDNFIILFLLAVIQGITEWLPVSSSGHLVLASRIFGYPNSIEMDVAMHFGTLMAVFVYFGKDIVDIIEDILKGKWKSSKAKTGWLILIGSIPAGIIGFAFEKYFEVAFGSLGIVALGFLITAVILLIASLDFSAIRKKKDLSVFGALFVGCAQALAIFPGISRSGSTISAGLLSGLTEKEAMRFSFLLSIPAIFGASLVTIGNRTLPSEMLWATLVSFFVGMASIHLLLKVLLTSKKNLRWFALYVLLLALGIGIYLFL
ncbi:MAG: undecaprenyl-diphosphate phosphatase [archaeon]|nr:undecaprenyl-diphosphate phosphatase [archaeon]